jgi:hypothetical protein
MARQQKARRWRRDGFLARLLASYFVIPIVPPVLLLLMTHGSSQMPLNLWLGEIGLYGIFGFAAMVALGTPLLLLFMRLDWTGFVPFMAGGGFCAGVTSYMVLRTGHDQNMVAIFTLFGIISGALFRLILFGLRPHSISSVGPTPEKLE